MVENELVVRLVECAKPLNSVYDSNDPTQVVITGWADTTTVPKRGEICLEYYTNNDPSSENYGKICYRMKIGDGIHKYIESNPDDSLPYFPLSDDVINLIVSWVNTHLNVNEYAQANYNNSTNTLKIYSINEEYGKIGHLADSEDTPSLDIEVTFSAGTKIDLTSENNTLTITHEDTTRADTDNATDIAANTKVVTGVTTDATGHITGITTYEFPEYTTIAPVQSVTGGNHITATTTNNAVTIDHDAVGTGSAVTPTSGTAPDWGGDVLTGVSIDSYGHVAGATKGALPSNPVSAASGTTNQIMVSDGDNTTSTSGKTITTTASSSTSDDTTVPTSKAVNTSIDNKIGDLDSSVLAGSNKVLTGVTEVDGKLTGKTDVDYTTIAPVQSVVGDNKWTSVSTSSNTATVSHIGPDTSSTSSATATQSTAPGFGGDVVTGVTIDSKGHVTGVTTGALPSNPVSSLEGTASDTASGITVQVDSTGGEVDNVDVTVALDTLKSALGLTGALIPKGTLGTGGTITTLPTASVSNLGWAYKVITDGTYSGISAKVGDVIYCILNNDGTTYSWVLIPSGDESFTDTWRNIKVNGVEKLGTGISSGALDVVDGSHSSVSWNGTNKTLQIDVDEASTSQKGVVELTDSYTSTDDTEAATGKSIKAAIDAMGVSSDKGAASIGDGAITIYAVQQEYGLIKNGGSTSINYDGTYNASTNKLATQSTVSNAINNLDVNSDKGAASISGSTLSITAVQQENGLIKNGGTTDISLDGTYDASTNKIATESTVTDAIEDLDVTTNMATMSVANNTITLTGVKETNGKIVTGTDTTVTIDGGNKLTASTSGTTITIDHDTTSHTTTQGTVATTDYDTVKETESLVVTGVTTDSYGHLTDVKVEPSTNLIAADIKAPVTKPDNSTWNYRETGGDITIGEDTAKIPSLKGNTVVWNQLVNGILSSASQGLTITQDASDKSFTITGTTTNIRCPSLFKCNTVNGHKYFLKPIQLGGSVSNTPVFYNGNNISTAAPLNYPSIYSPTGNNTYIGISVTTGTVFTNLKIHLICINLTKMFGSDFNIEKALLGLTTEVAWNNLTADQLALAATNFEKLFPNSYYPYCEGRLVNLGGYGVKWNQMVQNGNFEDGTTNWDKYGGTYTANSGVLTLTAGSTVDSAFQINQILSPSGSVGHKYFGVVSVNPSRQTSVRFTIGAEANVNMVSYSDATANTWTVLKGITTATYLPGEIRVYINASSALQTGDTVKFRNIILIDLTKMFGPGSEPTLEEFEAMFPKDYYEYNAGTEMNIFDAIGDKELGLESTGLNQYNDGQASVLKGEEYYIGGTYTSPITYSDGTAITVTNNKFTADRNDVITVTGGGTDTIINITCEKDGTYEPYKKDTLDLDWIRNEGVENFNIWDEEWEIGSLYENGTPNDTDIHQIRNKGYIPISSNTTYYFRQGTNTWVVYYYDSNKNFISLLNVGNSGTFVTPTNCAYLRFRGVTGYGTTYKNDICINISNAALNGEYHPYGAKAKYFPQGLLSAGAVYDEVQENKLIKRVGVVDLGSLTWIYAGSIFATTEIPQNSKTPLLGGINAIAAIYQQIPITTAQEYNNTFLTSNMVMLINNTLESSNRRIAIRNTSYSDGEIFKTAMSGVMLYYELATPIEIPLAEPHRMSYAVDDHGTEQQIPINVSSVINAPFVGTFEYYSNFKDGVLDLMGRFSEFTPTTKIIPDSNSTLPTSQAVIDYMRAGGNGVKPVYESGDEVTPTTDAHAGLKTEVGNNSYKYYKIPFSAVTNDPSEGTSQVQIILNGNFS